MKDEKDLYEDAEIKIEKLKFIVDDILEHGVNGGDQTARQIVMTAITKTDNEIFHKKLEQILFEKEEQELMKTIICGLFLQKQRHLPIIEYANSIVQKDTVFNEEFDEKESLLLVLDTLVNATKNKDEEEMALDALINLFNASCSENSTALIADQLLQRFLSVLPNRDHKINQKLLELVQEENTPLNSKLIAIDILGRSKADGFYPVLEKIILNMEKHTQNDEEKLYLMDVSTKILKLYVGSEYQLNIKKLLKELNTIQFVVSNDDQYTESILRRTQTRLKTLNDAINSMN